MDEFDLPTSDEPMPPNLLAVASDMLSEILRSVKAERALILVNLDGSWSVGTAHELPTEDFWNMAPVSLGILQAAVDQQEVVVLMDAGDSEFAARTSVVLTGVRSVACAPYILDDEAVVLVYVDSRINVGAFTPSDGETLQGLADELGHRLIEAIQAD